MNLIKSIFIFLAPLTLFVVLTQAILSFMNKSNILINIGLLMSTLPLLLFLLYILIFKKLARTSFHLPWVSVPSFLGYSLVLFVFIKHSNVIYINAMVYSMASFFITFLYIYWYSNNARKTSGDIEVSQQLPVFMLKDIENKPVSSESFNGKKTLIFFYRGNWCPLCMAQIDEIVKMYKQFEKHNIDVVFISPQPASHTESLAKRFDLSFKFYTDENNLVAEQFGIKHNFGLPMGFQALGYKSDSVYPTVIAIDEQGSIIYSDQTSNYRIRPEPEDLLGIFV